MALFCPPLQCKHLSLLVSAAPAPVPALDGLCRSMLRALTTTHLRALCCFPAPPVTLFSLWSPVPKSLPVQRKVEPPSLDPAEEPLLWEGLTLNKCILVASIVALLSVTFQVLQGEPGVGWRGTEGSDPAATFCLLSLPVFQLHAPGRESPTEEPTDVPEVTPAVTEVKKRREKKLEKKEEKAREARAARAERSSWREARAKDRAQGDKPSRAPRAPREPEQQPQKKRGREGKESRRQRDEPRREGWKGRPGRADDGRESPKRDWRQQKGRKSWEDGPARPKEGKRRD
uniref:Junctional sarcoplasmic reticulum protein 1 n=1 Tax=Strigops habroptila TaxID=2489341 RepID=A0A672UNB3_STRHB